MLFSKKREETATLQRIVNDISFVGTMGMIQGVWENSPERFLLGPTGALFVNTVNTLGSVLSGKKTIGEAATDTALREVSAVKAASKIVGREEEANYTSFVNQIRLQEKKRTAGWRGTIFGVTTQKSTSEVWNARNYSEFAAVMNRKSKTGLDLLESLRSTIKTANPAKKLSSLSATEKAAVDRTQLPSAMSWYKSRSSTLMKWMRQFKSEPKSL
jgi:hypothetical protein